MPISANTGFVPSNFVLMLRDYLRHIGAAQSTLLRKELAALKPNQQSFSLAKWTALLEETSAKLNDPQLGLHLGARAGPQHLGVLGYILLACGNIAGALARLQKYQKLVYDATPMNVRLGENNLQLVWDAEHGRPGALSDETGITAIVQLCREMVAGTPPNAERICFINARPQNVSEYEDWFGCPVLFEQAETLIQVSGDFLQAELKPAGKDLAGMFEAQANLLLSKHPGQSETVNQVQQVIARQLHWAEPSLADVASQLHMSARTLHRKLASHQLNYNALLGRTRRQLAEDYLANPSLQLAEISELLAYAEQSVFTRSFKRWTAMTPRDYRKQKLGLV